MLSQAIPGARERLTGLIEDEGIGEVIPIQNGTRIGKRGIHLAVWGLEAGFETPELTVISEQDVLGDRLIRQPKKRRKAENFLTEVQSLSPGDLVVHVDHGVGRFHGLEVVTQQGPRMNVCCSNMRKNRACICPLKILNCCPAMATKKGCWIVWAAGHGRRKRPS